MELYRDEDLTLEQLTAFTVSDDHAAREASCFDAPAFDRNLGSHRSKAVRQLIRSVGAKPFFLPKYSPDPNPIEQVFAKLKHLLRKAAARTVDVVCAAIGHAIVCSTLRSWVIIHAQNRAHGKILPAPLDQPFAFAVPPRTLVWPISAKVFRLRNGL